MSFANFKFIYQTYSRNYANAILALTSEFCFRAFTHFQISPRSLVYDDKSITVTLENKMWFYLFFQR